MEKRWKRINLVIVTAAHIYLLLPVMIFCIGWCKWYIGGIMSCLIAIGVYLSIRKYMDSELVERIPSVENRKIFWKYFVVVMIIVLWVFLSGIGGYVWQNDDHLYRNAIFNILVEKNWPVVCPVEINGVIQERALVYYIGFWLPASLIGKLLGLEAGYAFQCVWAILGITIFYSLVCYRRKKISLWPLFVFIFFSGMDSIGTLCNGESITALWGVGHLERWPGVFQYSSMTTQLFWVFNQAIPAWIACGLLFLQPQPHNCVLIWASIMLTSTIPFIGLFPYVVYIVFRGSKPISQYCSTAEYFKDVWKRTASLPNIICGGAIGIISALYLVQNTAGRILQKIIQIPTGILVVMSFCSIGIIAGIAVGVAWLMTHGYIRHLQVLCIVFLVCGVMGGSIYLLWRGYPANRIIMGIMGLLWFYLLEVGVYLLLLRPPKSRTGLWWICSVSLLIIPLIRIGESIDFCMRASIPGLILIYFWTVKRLEKGFKTTGAYVLCIVLIMGGITSLHEIVRTIVYSSGPYKIEAVAEETVLTEGNFSGEAQGFFWRHIAGGR